MRDSDRKHPQHTAARLCRGLLAGAWVAVAVACADTAQPTDPVGETGRSTVALQRQADVEWLDICHGIGAGAFAPLKLPEPAVVAHLAHGDAAPGDQPPGVEAKFLGDCTLAPIGPGLDVLGVAGGKLVSDDGNATLTIPPDALKEFTQLGLQHAKGFPVVDWMITNRVYEGTPHGLVLAEPAQLSIGYSDSDVVQWLGVEVPVPVIEPILHLHTTPGSEWSLLGLSTVDEVANRISASIHGFSWFGGGTPRTGDFHPQSKKMILQFCLVGGPIEQSKPACQSICKDREDKPAQWKAIELEVGSTAFWCDPQCPPDGAQASSIECSLDGVYKGTGTDSQGNVWQVSMNINIDGNGNGSGSISRQLGNFVFTRFHQGPVSQGSYVFRSCVEAFFNCTQNPNGSVSLSPSGVTGSWESLSLELIRQ